MPNAIERLLADHKMIRKTLEGYQVSNPRFEVIRGTLQRIILGHAWFEDTLLLPALEKDPRLEKRFSQEIIQEHEDIVHYLKLIAATPIEKKEDLENLIFQFKVVLDTHFKKEEDGLFPLAEKILKEEGLLNLSVEMEARKTAVQNLLV